MQPPKTLKDFFEVYRPKSPDEQRFVDKHVVIKHKDRNGNGDDVFNATNVKKSPRTKENHGYEPGDDEKVYEGLMAEEADGIDEAQGSFTRTAPMGKRQKDSWKPASKKPRKDFDRDKRTVKDDDLEEMTGSCDRVAPMSKPARYDASGGRKPRTDYNRAKRTIKKADLEEAFASLDEAVNFKHFTFTTGPKTSGSEGSVDHVKVSTTKATKLGVPHGAYVAGNYGQTKTVTVTNNETGAKTHHSVYQRDHVMGVPLFSIRSVGAVKPEHDAHGKALKAYLAGKRTIKEGVGQVNELSDELKTRYLVKTWPKRGETIPDKRKPFVVKSREAGDRHWAKQRADSEEAEKQAVLKRTPAVHDLRHMSHGQAYDHTQTSEKIKDGDVLHVKGGAAIMMKAWPTMVHGDSKSLHSWDAGHSWDDRENAHYGRAVKLAKSLKEGVESVDEAAPYYSLEASKSRMAKEKAREDAKKSKSDAGKAATQAKRDSKANQSHEIARHIETEVGNHYPDSDGFDAIAKKLRSQYGISSHAAIDHMDAAARKHLGAKSFSHYVDNFDKDYKKDNQHESAGQIDEVGDTKAGRAALGSYINKRTKDIAGQAYEAGLRRDTGTKSKSYKKELAGRVGIEQAVDKLTKPRKFRRYYGEELATSFIDKYIPELAETTALSSEDQLVTVLIDTGISEGIASDILMLHSSLDENNQRHLLAAIEAGEIDEVLDFAIQNRGE